MESVATSSSTAAAVAGVDDLKTLVLSYHPLIVIETVEEERVETLLDSLAARMNVTLMEWSVNTGLKLPDAESPVYGTTTRANCSRTCPKRAATRSTG